MAITVYRIDSGGTRDVVLLRQDGDTDYYPLNAPVITPITLLSGTGQAGDDLLAIEALTGTNTIYYRSAPNTWSPVVMGSGITFSGGILSAELTGALDGDLNSIAAASGTNTIYYRSAENTWSPITIGSGLAFSGGVVIASGVIGSFQPYDDDLTGLASLTGQNVLYYRTGAGLSGWAPVTFHGLGFENGQLTVMSGSVADLTGINVIHYRPNSGSWTDVKYTYPFESPGVPPLDVYLSTAGTLSGHLLSRALFDSANSRFLNYSNGIFVVFNNTGGLGPASGSFALSILNGGTSATSATQARINLGLEIGDDIQAWDADLDALSSISQRGLYYRETGSSWRPVLPTGNYGALSYKGVVLTTGGGAYLPPNSGYLVSLGLYDAGVGEYISSYNSGFVVSNYTGGLQRPFVIDVAHGGTASTGASGARTNLGLVIGTDVQGWDADLTSLSNASFTNVLYYRSGAGVWSPVSIGSGLSFISGTLTSSTSGEGGASQPLDGDLTSLSNASAVNSIYYRSAADMWDPLTITTGLVLANGKLYASGQASLTTIPVNNLIGTISISQGGTSATSAAEALVNLGAQPLDSDLTAISNLSGSGILYYRSGLNTWNSVIFGTGLSFNNGIIVLSGAGNFQPLDNDLTFLSNLTGSGIIYYRSGDSIWSPVIIGSGLNFNGSILTSSGIVGLIDIVNATTGTLPINRGGTNATTVTGARSQLGLVIGTDVQAWDADLDSLSSASSTNAIYYRASANTWSPLTVSTGLNFSGGTLTTTFPYVNIKDYGAVGDSLTDNSTSIQNAANIAKSNNARLIAPAGTYLLGSDVNLRQTNVDFTSCTLRLTGSTTKLILGGTSESPNNPPQKFYDIQRTGGVTSTPTVQVIGAKGQYISIDETDYIQFYADTTAGNTGPDASIAYSRFDLNNANRIELNTNYSTPNSLTQWINENSFFLKRCFELVSSGTYNHNHNYFYNGNYEDATIDFTKGASNIIWGARFEGTISINFGTGTFANKIFYGYESNQRTQYDDLVTPTVIDSGEGNTVGSIARTLQFRQPVVIVNNTTCHTFSNNAGVSAGDRGPNYTTLQGVDVQRYGVDTFHRASFRKVYDSPLIRVARGEALSFSSDRNLFRGSIKIYDSTKTLITNSDPNAGSYLRTSAGLTWDSVDTYTSSSNRSNFLAIVVNDKVSYVKFDVNAGNVTTSVPFSGFSIQKIVFNPSAQKLYEESEYQSPRMASVSAMPSIGFAPEVGMKVGGTVGGTYTATSALDTTLSSGSPSGATTIALNSVSNIVSGDVISIKLDNGSTDWTKVNSTPVGSTLTLLVALSAVAASGNRVTTNKWIADSGTAASLDGDLTSLASAVGTNTIYYRSAADTWSPVTISTGLNFGGGLLAVTGDGTLLTGLNASSLVIGTVPSSRGGAGSINGILKSDGAGNVSAATINTDFQQSSLDLIALSSLTGSPNLYYRQSSGFWNPISNIGNPPLDVYLTTGGSLSGHLLSRSLYNVGNNTFLAYSGTNLGIYNSDGSYSQDFILPVSHGGTNAATVAGARTSLGLVIGTNVQAYHDDLQSLSQLTQTGVIYYRHNTGSWMPVIVGSGLAFVSGTLVNSGDVLTLDGDLNALAALNGTHNVYYRSAENTWTSVQFVSGIAFVGDKIFASGNASLLTLPVENLVGVLSISQGGTNAINASDARQELGLEIGVDVQGWDSDLQSLANTNQTGIIYYRSGIGVWSPITIGSGLRFDSSSGLLISSGAIGSFQPLDSDLTSLSNTNQIGVIYYRSGDGNWSPITIGSGLRLNSSNGLLISSGIIGGYQPLDTDLTLISSLNDSNTLYFRRNDIAWDPVLPLNNRNIYRNTILSSGGSNIPYSGHLITIGLMDRVNQDFLYIEDEILYKSDITGGSNSIFVLDISNGGTSATSASQARTNLGAQTQDTDLDSLSATSLTGMIYYRSGNGTWSPITIGSGLNFNANIGILTSSGIVGSYQPLDGDLTAISNLGGTHNVYYRSATDTWTPVNFISGITFVGDNVIASGNATLLTIPVNNLVGIIDITQGGTSATSASEALVNLGGQPLDSDLTSLASTNQTGIIYYRSGIGSWHPVIIGSGLAFNANLGVITSSGAVGSFQPLDGDLTAIAALNGTHDIYHRSAADVWTSTNFISGISFIGSNIFLSGISNLLNIPTSNLIGTLSIGMGGTSATNATAALSNLGGQPIDADLTSISAISETGIIYYRSGNGVWSPITVGSGLRFNANIGLLVSSGIIGDYQPLDADLTAIANLNGTNTIYYRSAADTWSAVTVSSGLQFNNGIIIVSGNGTLLNALNGSSITQGTVSSNHGGAGAVNGILKANGIGIVSAAGANIDYQSADTDLISLANTNQTGVVYYRSGDGAWSPITIGSGLRFDANNGLLVSSGIVGSYQPLDGDLTSISNLSNTNVLHYRSATDTWSTVTITTGVAFDNGKLFASGNGSLLTTLNASNLSVGTVASSRGGAGTVNGILKADGAGNVSAAGSNIDYQAADSDLISIANTNQTGIIYYRSGDGNWSPVTIGSGLRFNANQGILISSGGIQSLDADLNSLANLDGTTTLYFRSGNSDWGPVRPTENRNIYKSVILSTGGTLTPYSGYLISKGLHDSTQNEFLSINDNILYTSDITGGTLSTFILDISNGGTNAGTAGQALSNLGGQPLDTDLTSISNLSQTGIIYYRSGNGVWSPITIGSGLVFNQNIGILTISGINIPTGTIATQNANNIDIQGGTIQGISSLSVNGTVGISNNLNVVGAISGNGAYITGISAFNITGGDLQALENLTQTGSMFYRVNTNVWNAVIPASGLFFNSGNGELGARLGSVVQRWDGDLEAISALTGINTIYYRSATNTWNPVQFGSGVTFSNGILIFTGTGGITNTNLEVNVLNYGAVGNGIADDTAAFISAGGGVPGRRILVPGGYKYRITSTLASALASGQTWYGNGDIVTDNGFNFNVFEINNKPDITIFGLTAHGGTLGAPYSSADARFILAYGNSARTKMLYCNIYGFQSAALVSAPYCDLSHNTIIGTTGWGLFADEGAAGVLISYNNVSGVKASYGIYTKGQNTSNRLKSPTVIGNNVFNGQSYGIVTNYVDDARIGFNTCSNNTFDGIFLNNGSTRGKVFGNICDFNDNGIAFYEIETTSIRNEFFNNTLRQNANAGFILNGAAPGYINANSIYDNQFESNSNYGLITAGPSSSTFIENNRFYSESIGILSVGTGDIIESNEFVDCTEKYMGSATSIIRQYNSFTGIVLNTATGLRQLLLGSGLSVTGGTTLVASVTYALDQDLQAIESLNGTNTLYFRQSNGVWSPTLPTDNRDIYKTTILSTGGSSVPYSGYLISKGFMDSIQQDFLYLEDDILYTANLTGGNSTLFTLDLTNGGTSANTASGARANLGLIIGTNVQAYDADLTSLSNTNLTDVIYYRSGAGIWSPVTISSGLTFVNGILMSSGRSEVISYISGGVNNINRDDVYKHYVNTGSSLTQFLLPSAFSGLGPYSFTVDDSDGIQIRAAVNDVIRLGPGSITTGNGYVVSTDIGSSLTLISLNDITWQAKSVVGYWSVS